MALSNTEMAWHAVQNAALKVKSGAGLETGAREKVDSLFEQYKKNYEPTVTPFQAYANEHIKFNADLNAPIGTANWTPSFALNEVLKIGANNDYRTADLFKEPDAPWWAKGLNVVGVAFRPLGIPLGIVADAWRSINDIDQGLSGMIMGKEDPWKNNNPFTWERTKQTLKIYSGQKYYSFGEWLQDENWLQDSWSTQVPINPLRLVGVGPDWKMTVSASGLAAMGPDLILDPLNWFGGLGVYRHLGTAAARNGTKVLKTATRDAVSSALRNNFKKANGIPLGAIDEADLASRISDRVIDDLVSQVQVSAANALDEGVSVTEAITSVFKEFKVEDVQRINISGARELAGGSALGIAIGDEVIDPIRREFWGNAKYAFDGQEEIVDELVEFAEILLRAQQMGRSSLSVGDINKLKNWGVKHGYNQDLMSKADWLAAGGAQVDDTGKAIDGLWQRNEKDFRDLSKQYSLGDVVKAEYGIKAPFTGDIARFTRLPFTKKSFGENGATLNQLLNSRVLPPNLRLADRQYGITVARFTNQYADKLFRSLPRAFRGTWGKARKMRPDKTVGIVGRNLNGGMANAKATIKTSDNPWAVMAAKEFINTAGMGRNVSRRAFVQLNKQAARYLESVGQTKKESAAQQLIKRYVKNLDGERIIGDGSNSYGRTIDEAFDRALMSALEGDVKAIKIFDEIATITGNDLVDQGRNAFALMRQYANKTAGVDFLNNREFYFPHQLDPESLAAMRRTAKSARKGQTVDGGATNASLKRGYLPPDQYVAEFKKWEKTAKLSKDMTEEAKFAKFEKETGVKQKFMGVDLTEVAEGGSIPEQISKILRDYGMDDKFFSHDIASVMNNYVKGISQLTGGHWTEQQFVKGGWAPNASDWISSVVMPDMTSVKNTISLNLQTRKMVKNQDEIDELIVLLAQADAQILKSTDERLAGLYERKLALEQEYEEMLNKAREHRNYTIGAERNYIEAKGRMVELQEEIQTIVSQEEEIFLRTRKFVNGEIGIEQFPEFQDMLNKNQRLREINQEINALFLGGENELGTDTVYYFIYDSLRSGVQARALLISRLENKFGSVDEAMRWVQAYTEATGQASQLNKDLVAQQFTGQNPVDLGLGHEEILEIIENIPEEVDGFAQTALWVLTNQPMRNYVDGNAFNALEQRIYALAKGIMPEDIREQFTLEQLAAVLENVVNGEIAPDPAKLQLANQIMQDTRDIADEANRLRGLFNDRYTNPEAVGALPELATVTSIDDLTDQELQQIIMNQAFDNNPEATARLRGQRIREGEGALPDEATPDAIEGTLREELIDEYNAEIDRYRKEYVSGSQSLDEQVGQTLDESQAAKEQLGDQVPEDFADAGISQLQEEELRNFPRPNQDELHFLNTIEYHRYTPDQIRNILNNGYLNTPARILKVGNRQMSYREVSEFFDEMFFDFDQNSLGEWFKATYWDEMIEDAPYNTPLTFFRALEVMDAQINRQMTELDKIAKHFGVSEYDEALDGPIDFYGIPTVENVESWRRIIAGYMNAGLEEQTNTLVHPVASQELTNATRRYYLLMGKTRLAKIENSQDLMDIVQSYKAKLENSKEVIQAELAVNPFHQLEMVYENIRVTREQITNLDSAFSKTSKAIDDGIDVPSYDESFPLELDTISPEMRVDPAVLGFEGSEAMRSTGPMDPDALDGIYQLGDKEYYLVKSYTVSGADDNGRRLDRAQRDQAVLASKVYQLLGIKAPRVEARTHHGISYTITRLNPDAALLPLDEVGNDLVNKVSLGFMADVLLGNWGVMGRGAKTNVGVTSGLLDGGEVVRYGLDDTFFTSGGFEKGLDPSREYLVLDYVDGKLELVPRRPEFVSVDPETQQITKYVPEGFAEEDVLAKQKYDAEAISYEKDLKIWEQDSAEWRSYDVALRRWERKNGTQAVLSNDMSEEQIYETAKNAIAKQKTAEEGLVIFSNDVPIDYPIELDNKINEIEEKLLQDLTVVNVETPAPTPPPRPRPAKKPPKAPEKPKGVSEPAKRGTVTYKEADGTVRTRAARKPSKVETEARRGEYVSSWLEAKGIGKKDRIYGTRYTQWRQAQAAERRAAKKIRKIQETTDDPEELIARVVGDLNDELDDLFRSVDDISKRTSVAARTPLKADGTPRVQAIGYDLTQVMELGLGTEIYGLASATGEEFLVGAGSADFLSSQVDELLNARLSVGGWRNFVENVIPYADEATREELAEFLEMRTMYLAEYLQKPYLVDEDEMLKAFAADMLPQEAVLEAYNTSGKEGVLKLLDNVPAGGYDEGVIESGVIDGVPQFLDSGPRRTLAPFAYRDGVSYRGLGIDLSRGDIRFYGLDPDLQGEVQPVLEGLLGLSEINWNGLDMNSFVDFNEFQMTLVDFFTELSTINPAGRKTSQTELAKFTDEVLRLVAWNGPTRQMPSDMISVGERLIDVMSRVDGITLDEILRIVGKDALTRKQVAAIDMLLVNPYRTGLSENIELSVPLTGVSPDAEEGKVFVNHLKGIWDESSGVYKDVPFRVDTVSGAERAGGIKAISAVAKTQAIIGSPVGNNILPLMPEGGTFQEVFEFVSWRDNKYRQIDMAMDGLTESQGLRLFMDDLAEYIRVTDPSNPSYRQEVLKAKMQSYVYANRLFSYLSQSINKTGKNKELLDLVVKQYKNSLVSDGYIATSQPRTIAGGRRAYSKQAQMGLIDLSEVADGEMTEVASRNLTREQIIQGRQAGNHDEMSIKMPFVMDVNVVDDAAVTIDRELIERTVDQRIRANALKAEPEKLPSREKMIDDAILEVAPNREALIRRYEEQVRTAWADPFTNGEDVALRNFKAKALGYKNFDTLLRDLIQRKNEVRQLKYNHNNLKAAYLDRLKTLSEKHRIGYLSLDKAEISDDLRKLRQWLPDDQLEESGIIKQLGDVEKQILAEHQIMENIQSRLLQYEDARNNLQALINGLDPDQAQTLESYDAIIDLASSLKQIGIADMEQADELLGDLNNVKYLVDEIEVPAPDQMGNKTKLRLEETLRYQNNASRRPIGLNAQSSESLRTTMMGNTKMGLEQGKPSGAFGKYYDNVHNITKGYMILKSGFLARNFYGAVWMNYLANVSPSAYKSFSTAYKYLRLSEQHADLIMFDPTNTKKLRKAEKAVAEARKATSAKDINIVKQMYDTGVIGKEGSGFYAQEFIPSEKRTIKIGKKKFRTSVRVGKHDIDVRSLIPISSQFAPLKGFRRVNSRVEDYVRGALGYDTINKGGTLGDAWDQITKYHFDYSDLSPAERNVKRVIPFYTFTRHNVPLQIGQYFKQPQKFHRYSQVMQALHDKEQPEYGPVPDWMVRQGGIRLPKGMNYNDRPVYFIPDLPMRSVFDLLGEPLGKATKGDVVGGFESAFSGMGGMVTPLVKGPAEIWLNRNIWKGYSFQNKWEEVPFWAKPLFEIIHTSGMTDSVQKTPDGNLVARSNWLHGITQMFPLINDLRRVAPTEEKYSERHFSNIMSYFAGIGTRVLTKYEVQQEITSEYYDDRQEKYDLNTQSRIDEAIRSLNE